MTLRKYPHSKAPKHVQAPDYCDPGCSWQFRCFRPISCVTQVFLTAGVAYNGSFYVRGRTLVGTAFCSSTASSEGGHRAVLENRFNDGAAIVWGATDDFVIARSGSRQFAVFESIGFIFTNATITLQRRNCNHTWSEYHQCSRWYCGHDRKKLSSPLLKETALNQAKTKNLNCKF